MKSTYRKNLWRALKRLVSDSPGILPLAVLLAAVEAAYPYIEILLSAEILNELASPDRNRDHLIFLALLLPGLSCLGRMANAFCGQLLDVLQYVEMKRLEGSVAEKAWRMDYSMASDPVNNERRRKLMRWHYSRFGGTDQKFSAGLFYHRDIGSAGGADVCRPRDGREPAFRTFKSLAGRRRVSGSFCGSGNLSDLRSGKNAPDFLSVG